MRALSKHLSNADKQLSRQPIPVFNNPHHKEMFPHVHPEPSLVQLCAVPMHTTVGSQGAQVGISLSVSPQEAAESNEVTSQPPFPQTVLSQDTTLRVTASLVFCLQIPSILALSNMSLSGKTQASAFYLAL